MPIDRHRSGDGRHPMVPHVHVALHDGRRESGVDKIPDRNGQDRVLAFLVPIQGRPAGRAEVIGHRVPCRIANAIDLKSVENLRFP